jgi:hypothetical protein
MGSRQPGRQRRPFGLQLSNLSNARVGRSHHTMPQIARENCTSLSVAQFWSRYMLPNRPVLINISELTAEWRVMADWVTTVPRQENEGSGRRRRQLNTQHMKEHFGADKVAVYDCAARRVMGRLPHARMRVREFLDRRAKEANEADTARELLYLKDWNVAQMHPSYRLYECPAYFREDWLNDHEAAGSSDHRFVYLGPKDRCVQSISSQCAGGGLSVDSLHVHVVSVSRLCTRMCSTRSAGVSTLSGASAGGCCRPRPRQRCAAAAAAIQVAACQAVAAP